MRFFARLLGVWLTSMLPAAAIGFVACPAAAQVSAADKAVAEALFDDAKRLFLKKEFAEACPRFERSQRLDPGIGTLLFLGDCYENLGRSASAWATFREAAGAAKVAGQADREQIARGRASILEPKLFRLMLKVSAADTPGLTVKRNQVDVPKEAWSLPIPVDPGASTIEVTAPGRKPWSTRIGIPQGAGEQTVIVPALGEGAAATAPPPPPPSPPAPVGTNPGRGQQIAGLAIGAAGLGGVIVGMITGVQALNSNGKARELCQGVHCINQQGVDLLLQSRRSADISTGTFIGGGAALALGVTLFFTAPKEPKEGASARRSESSRSSAGLWLGPAVSAGSLGLIGGGSW